MRKKEREWGRKKQKNNDKYVRVKIRWCVDMSAHHIMKFSTRHRQNECKCSAAAQHQWRNSSRSSRRTTRYTYTLSHTHTHVALRLWRMTEGYFAKWLLPFLDILQRTGAAIVVGCVSFFLSSRVLALQKLLNKLVTLSFFPFLKRCALLPQKVRVVRVCFLTNIQRRRKCQYCIHFCFVDLF